MSRAFFVTLFALGALLGACTAEPLHPPPAPNLDGSVGPCVPYCSPPPTDGGPRDLGSTSDGGRSDASSDAGLGGFCAAFPRAGSSASLPIGFAPTRIVARWDTESCAVPELVVALTEGGCDLADGERLELRFREAQVTDGSIAVGLNTLYAEVASPLSLTYVRTAAPSATVGPCGVGQVVIGALSLARGGRFSATIDVTLDDCALVGDTGINVVASIDVPILASSADACP
jgi:hypothetical protein